jgi:Domain of unknown function (DUF4160)
MPTILRDGPYRFFFFSGDRDEPPHVHVERDDCEGKFWLDPVRLERSEGFSSKELNRIHQIVQDHQVAFLGSWHEFFGN